MTIESWKQEFDRKYRKLMNSGDTAKMDAANEVVTDAICKLDQIPKILHSQSQQG